MNTLLIVKYFVICQIIT